MDNYELLDKIRNSLYGSIYRAIDKRNQRKVVIKRSDIKLVTSFTSRSGKKIYENVNEEIKVNKDIINLYPEFYNMLPLKYKKYYPLSNQCESITMLYDSFKTDRYVIQVFEHMKCDLHDYFIERARINDKNRRCECIVRYVFKQIISAILYLHTIGIAHVDISLENILIDKNYTVKICDFALCRRHQTYPNININQSKSFECKNREEPYYYGKSSYCSPEIYDGVKYDLFKNDIHCLGIILVCMLMGSFPYNKPCDEDPYFIAFNHYLKYRLDSTHKLDTKEFRELWKLLKYASDDFIDLVNKLVTNESDRLSIYEIYDHQWINQKSCCNH